MEPKLSNEWGQLRIIRREELGELIRTRRKRDGFTLQQAAQQCKVSAATLWRLEKQAHDRTGKKFPEPDTMTLGRVTHWLGVSLDRVLETSVASATDSIGHSTNDSTPDMIEAHLRADRKLDPQSAAALGRIFRVAYEQFQQSGSAPTTPVNQDDAEK